MATETKNSRFGNFCLFMTSVCLPAVSSYHFVVFNPITPVLQNMFNRTYMKRYNETLPNDTFTSLLAITQSAVIMGGLLGAICTRPLLLWMCRKRLFQLAHLLNLPAVLMVSLVGSLTEAYEVFIIGRILTGFPIGIMYTITPLMVAEMSARNKQGFWQSMIGIAVGFGLLIGAVVAHPKVLGNDALWPAAVALSAIPSISYLISSYWIPHTLYSLVRKGDKEETLEAIRIMRIGHEEDFEEEYEEMLRETDNLVTVSIKDILTTRQYRLHFIVVLCLFLNLILCGINVFVLYSDLLFIKAGIPPDQVTYGTIGIFGGQFIVSIGGSKLIDRCGGRRVMLTASCLEILALILFTASQATLHLAPNVLSYLAIVSAAIFIIAWSGGTNLATLALMGAVTIEPTRPACFSAGGILFWIFSWFTGFIPAHLENIIGPYSMVPWLICTIVFLIYFVIFLPETKGKTVDEVQGHFKAKRAQSAMPLTSTTKA